MAISYLGNKDTQDTFTLGSSASAVVNGQTGTENDIVRITKYQTATVNATSDDTQTLVFEAGIKLQSVQSNAFGTKVVFVNADNTTTTVQANASNTFQVGSESFTADEFVTWAAGKNIADGTEYEILGTEGAADFAISANVTAVNEGSTVTISIANAVAGEDYSYSLTGVEDADVDGDLTGTVRADKDGNGTLEITLSADATTEGAETLTVTINGQTVDVTVNDTSEDAVVTPDPSFTLTVDAAATVTEAVATNVLSNVTITENDGASVQGATLEIGSTDASGTLSFSDTVTRYDNDLVISGNIVGTIQDTLDDDVEITLSNDVTAAEVQALLEAVQFASSNVGGEADIEVTLTAGGASVSQEVDLTTLAATPLAFTDLDGDNQYPTIEQGPVVVDADVAVNSTASFGDDFEGGTLTIALGTGTEATDVLSLPTTLGGNVIVVDGSVYVNTTGIVAGLADTLIGTVTGNGVAGESLVVTFNSDATQALVNEVLQAATFDADDAIGTDGVREIDFTIEADGQTATATATLAVTSSSITLTADADGVTGGVQPDTNATFDAAGTAVAPSGINVFTAAQGTLTGNGVSGTSDEFSGGSTNFDRLVATITNGDDIHAIIDNVEVFDITHNATGSGATVDFASTTNTDGNDMVLTLTSSEDVTLENLDGFTSVDLTDATDSAKTVTMTMDAGQAMSVTAGESIVDITGSGTYGTDAVSNVSINADNIDDDVVGVVAAGNANVTVTNNEGDINASALDGTLTVTMKNVAANGASITTGAKSTEINGIVAGDTITVDADALEDDQTLTVIGAGNVIVSGATDLVADLDASQLSGDLTVTTKALDNEALDITLGSGENVSVTTADGAGTSAVTIDATNAVAADFDSDENTADTNVQLAIIGDAETVTVNNLTADVDAANTAFTGDLILNTTAGAVIAVASNNTGDLTFGGAADTVTIDAADQDASIVFGSSSASYAADVEIDNAGAAGALAIDATYLNGALDIDGEGTGALTITLGADVDSAEITHANAGDTIDATDFAGTLTLDGTAAVAVSNLAVGYTATDATGDVTATFVDGADVNIVTGQGSDTLETAEDGVTASTFNIDALAAADGQTITVTNGTDVTTTDDTNANIVATNLIADLDLSGMNGTASTETVQVTTQEIADSAGTTITLGSHESVTVNTDAAAAGGTLGTVTIEADAQAIADFSGTGNSAPELTLTGNADITVNDIHGNVTASSTTGGVTLNAADADEDNTLIGGSGNDTITGGQGVDTLTGGTGNDIFVITGNGDTDDSSAGNDGVGGVPNGQFDTGYGAGSRDIITDFVINTDVIDLTDMYKDSGDANDGVAVAFTDLSVSKGPDSTIITIDTNGDSLFDTNDVQIELTGNFGGYDIGASSFLFA